MSRVQRSGVPRRLCACSSAAGTAATTTRRRLTGNSTLPPTVVPRTTRGSNMMFAGRLQRLRSRSGLRVRPARFAHERQAAHTAREVVHAHITIVLRAATDVERGGNPHSARGPPRATRTHVVVCTPDRVGVVVVVVAAALARGASGTSESLRVALARRVTAVVDIREGGLLAALCSRVSDRQATAVAAPPRYRTHRWC